ncbi:holin [Pandoraea apista]|nr:holin [Pandoraea apista]
MIAGVVLIQIPDIPPLALYGIGSALGVVGAQFIEGALKRKGRQFLGDRN